MNANKRCITLIFTGNYRWKTELAGLIKAAEELGISADRYWHTAYDDAVNTSNILLKLIDDEWKPEHSFASH